MRANPGSSLPNVGESPMSSPRRWPSRRFAGAATLRKLRAQPARHWLAIAVRRIMQSDTAQVVLNDLIPMAGWWCSPCYHLAQERHRPPVPLRRPRHPACGVRHPPEEPHVDTVGHAAARRGGRRGGETRGTAAATGEAPRRRAASVAPPAAKGEGNTLRRRFRSGQVGRRGRLRRGQRPGGRSPYVTDP